MHAAGWNGGMKRKLPAIAVGTVFLLLVSGCTYQAWFEGFKERQRQECYKHVNDDDIQRCLENVEEMSYEEYKRSRSDTL